MSVLWYLTGYTTKSLKQMYNTSTVLADAVEQHEKDDSYMHDICECGRKLMFKCWSALNSKTEVSGQQVVMCLMGWGDTFEFHHHVPLLLSSFVAYLKANDEHMHIGYAVQNLIMPFHAN